MEAQLAMPAQRLWAGCSLRTPATLITVASSPAMFSSLFQWSDDFFQEGDINVWNSRSKDTGVAAALDNSWIACRIVEHRRYDRHSSGEGAVRGAKHAALRNGRRQHHNRRP